MSMFDLKGGSEGNNWNYSDNTKANYSEWIQGTVVEISNPQARDFNTGAPATWPDGNPKRNLMLMLLQNDGAEVTWTFSPKSAAANACLAALDPNGTRETVSIEELLGKFVTVQTQAGVYNARNPRPWTVVVNGEGQANMVRGLKDLSKPQPMSGMPAPAPAPQPASAPTQFQMAQQAAAQAVAAQSFQPQPTPQVTQPVMQVPNGVSAPLNVYDSDIPF